MKAISFILPTIFVGGEHQNCRLRYRWGQVRDSLCVFRYSPAVPDTERVTTDLCRLRVKPSFGSPGSRLWDRHPAIHVAGSGGRRQEREGSQQSLIKPVITVGACTLIPLGNWKLAWDPHVRATSGTWGIWGIYTLLSVLTGPPRGRYLSCILQPWCFQVNRPWLHEKAPSESAVRSVGPCQRLWVQRDNVTALL